MTVANASTSDACANRKRRLALAIAVASLGVSIAYAIDDLELRIDSVQGPDWQARGLIAAFDLAANAQRARVHIDTLKLAQLPEALRNVVIECPHVEMSPRAFACREARAIAQVPLLGEQTLRANVRYERGTGALELDVANLKIGTGRAAVRASLHEDTWDTRVVLEEVPLEVLVELSQAARVSLPVASATGSTSLQVRASGRGAAIRDIHARGSVQQLVANNESGSFATDGLAARFEIALLRTQEGWDYEASLVADQGQGYVEPIFLDFGVHAFELAARGALVGTDRLHAEYFRIAHSSVLSAQGRGALDFANEQPVRDLDVRIEAMQFPGAYETYLQPLLIETDFKSMRMKGELAGEVSVRAGAPHAFRLTLNDIDLEGDQLSLAMHGVRGNIDWNAETGQNPTPSEVAWSGGMLFGLELGPASLRFATAGTDFELLAPTRIPLLDGALQLDALAVQRAGSAHAAFRVDASIQPISVARLCQAFGWPEFGGRVSGAISNLQLQDGVLTLGTVLEAQVFDGLVTVKDLRLDEPFGNWPRLYANIDLHTLDLDLVTSAFSFGRITGRLSGSIHELELFNWSPVAFDARLFTPENDRSRHRISQRAVENIGSIGGGGAGVTAALSSGFLRFFDDFNYARLGITCKLTNEICEMGGVGPAPNGGYYLVQGRGLPRIDVIGNARRVDWPRLVRQLIDATQSGGPVVD